MRRVDGYAAALVVSACEHLIDAILRSVNSAGSAAGVAASLDPVERSLVVEGEIA